MARVNGSALEAGDALFGEFDSQGSYSPYHHPFLVISTETDRILIRNCTSNESASLNTIKIARADKSGDIVWTKKDSYLVTSGTAAVKMLSIPFQYGMQEVVVQGKTEFKSYVDEDGATCFGPVTPTWVELCPRIVQVHSNIQYSKIGAVKPERMRELEEELVR